MCQLIRPNHEVQVIIYLRQGYSLIELRTRPFAMEDAEPSSGGNENRSQSFVTSPRSTCSTTAYVCRI